ncbi:MAG: hypothetical protein KIT00_04695 [Rhodospirillales bacterium]|nr:hypothetical protein [Rhodospirillales bacterium]
MRMLLREKNWVDFVAWCKLRRLTPLPAHPWTVAAYARWCEPRHRFPVVVKRINAIARAHILSCETPPDRHPMVTRTLRLIEMRERARPQRSALFASPEAAPGDGNGARFRKKTNADKSKATSKRVRTMRASPRLVSRRPVHP